MTAKSKQGLDYFPFDVDFLFDLQTRRLMKLHGPEIIYAYINLSANIYKYEGYYAVYNEDLIFATAESMFIDEEKVVGLIRKCVDAGFFDREKWEEYGILTSGKIQETFLFATKRRKYNPIKKEYLVTNEKITAKTEKAAGEKQDVTSCRQDVGKNEQRKRESKNKSKSKGGEVVVGRRMENEIELPPVEQIEEIETPSPSPPAWKNDFKIYIRDLTCAIKEMMDDKDYLDRKQKLYPDVDIALTFEKIITEFWGTERGWMRKRRQAEDVIDWRLTFDRQISYPYNVIRKNKK